MKNKLTHKYLSTYVWIGFYESEYVPQKKNKEKVKSQIFVLV